MDSIDVNKIEKIYSRYAEENNLLPIKISDFYMAKVKKEIKAIGKGGPLYLSVYPTLDKITVHSSHETRDFVEEYKHMPVYGADYIIQKYDDRVLVILTDTCFAHCQYCFRTYNLSHYQRNQLKETIINKTKVLKKYLLSHPEIKEVILSGGDPLTLQIDTLSYVLSELSGWIIRMHTRAIVYNPSIFTEQIINLLSAYNVKLVFHINHPYEICSVVTNVIETLDKAYIRMYAQFPLLRGINDNYIVLSKLLGLMDELHIRPISVFIPDPIKFGTSYRISYNRILNIMDDLCWKTPSWINSVRFVLDTTYGKVRRENLIKREGNCLYFLRGEHIIKYYDLDEGIDVPSSLNRLLWKNNIEEEANVREHTNDE